MTKTFDPSADPRSSDYVEYIERKRQVHEAPCPYCGTVCDIDNDCPECSKDDEPVELSPQTVRVHSVIEQLTACCADGQNTLADKLTGILRRSL